MRYIIFLVFLFLSACGVPAVYENQFDIYVPVGYAELVTTKATPNWMFWNESTFSVWIYNKTGEIEFVPIDATSPDALSEFSNMSSLADKVTFTPFPPL